MAGGVGDYTRLVACALAAQGDRVEVWAPSIGASEVHDSGILVHRLADRFGPRALSQLSRSGAGRNGRRMFLQFVPQAFGMRGMNLPLCLWLLRRRCLDAVMFHEVAYPIQRRQPLRHNILGVVTRVMAGIIARASRRVFVSIPAWETELRRHLPRYKSIRWLPIPSTIPVVRDPEGTALARRKFLRSEKFLLGHFGTYGPTISEALELVIAEILKRDRGVAMLLLGNGSTQFRQRLVNTLPGVADRVHATGPSSRETLSTLLRACELMVQPYPDGITTRRTSAMAALAHSRAVVATTGHLTEPLWAESGAVKLTTTGSPSAMAEACLSLVRQPETRRALEESARMLYDQHFDLRHTVAALRDRIYLASPQANDRGNAVSAA
jgi:glycosyltransferase involved in cell wall biosynthesis